MQASKLPYLGTAIRGLTKEFRIPHPCGFIAGKTWGDSNNKPVLCLHGWLDNCNTFDRLIPLLPKNYFYVAFDFLGYGLSSHLPIGGWYMRTENVTTIKRVVNYFEWNKDLILLGHSMGGNIAGVFAAVFPEYVKNVIVLDAAGIYPTKDERLDGRLYRRSIDGYLRHELAVHPPVKQYTYEEAKDRLQGNGSGDKFSFFEFTDDAADVMLERSLKEEESGLFTFRRDFRHRLPDPVLLPFQEALSLFNNIKSDVHIIRALQSPLAEEKLRHKLWSEISKKNVYFHGVNGNHHVHLNQPTNVAPIITKIMNGEIEQTTFLNKL